MSKKRRTSKSLSTMIVELTSKVEELTRSVNDLEQKTDELTDEIQNTNSELESLKNEEHTEALEVALERLDNMDGRFKQVAIYLLGKDSVKI